MVVVDRAYEGAAVQTELSGGGMTALIPGVAGTFSVADATGYPATGKFEVVVDRGLDTEEKILVNSRSGTTFTVGARGYDDTTATDHSNGADVEHCFAARSLQLLVDHVDDVEADPHSTKLLNNTRHDITARHAFGAAFGTPGTPTALAIGGAGNAGSGARPAREDHAHAMPAFAAPVAVGTSNQSGAATTVPRSDHVHDLGAGVIDLASIIANGIITFDKIAAVDASSYSPNFGGLSAGDSLFYGRYWRIGDIVIGFAGFNLNTTGNVTGTITYELPVTGADLTGNVAFGNIGGIAAARSFHGASGRFSGLGILSTTNALNFATAGGDVWDGTHPVNWDPDDIFQSFFCYMAA